MLGNKVAVVLVGIASSIVLARAMGPSGRGSLAVAISFTAILVQIGSLGFPTANPYFAAQRLASAGAIARNSIWVAAVLGSLLLGVALVVKAVAPSVVAGLDWLEVVLATIALPAMLAQVFLQSVLLGEGRTIAYNVVEAAAAIGTLGALIVVEATAGLGVTIAITIVTAGHWIAFVIYAWLLRDELGGSLAPSGRLVREMAGYAARIYFAGLLAYVVIRVDVLLVNGYLGSSEAGYYTLAVAISDMLYVFPLVVAVNMFPRLSRGGTNETSAEVFRAVALVFAVVCAVTALLAKPLIRIFYGVEFDPSAALFWWLAPGAFAAGILNILSYHFAARGYPIRILLYWAAALVLNMGMNIALLPAYGTYIASLSSSVTYVALLVVHARLFSRDAGGLTALVPRVGETTRMIRTAMRPSR